MRSEWLKYNQMIRCDYYILCIPIIAKTFTYYAYLILLMIKKPKEFFAFVFYVDIVSLSDRNLGSTESQSQKINILFEYIKNSSHFKKFKGLSISLTGDGCVICYDNPASPLELALELCSKLKRLNKNKPKHKIEIRIGIAFGLIMPTQGIRNQTNFWGIGSTLSQRIMDMGIANHILIDNTTAYQLTQFSDRYRDMIHYVGATDIKHGEIIPVYSIHGTGFGNKSAPNLQRSRIYTEENSGRLIIEPLSNEELADMKKPISSFLQRTKTTRKKNSKTTRRVQK